MIVHHNITQGSEEWFALRRGKVTASRFTDFTAPDGTLKQPREIKRRVAGELSSSVESYIHELIAETWVPDFVPFEGNFWTDRGTELEPEARAAFEERTKIATEQVGFCTREDRIAGCSPDALIRDPDGAYVAGLELKCPAPKTHVGYIMRGGLPPEYAAQVHGGMAVTGLNEWWFMSYFPGLRPHLVRVVRDDYTNRLTVALNSFICIYGTRRELSRGMLAPTTK